MRKGCLNKVIIFLFTLILSFNFSYALSVNLRPEQDFVYAGQYFTAKVLMSEAVLNFTKDQITINGGSIIKFERVNSMLYRISVAPSQGYTEVVLKVEAGKITSYDNNKNENASNEISLRVVQKPVSAPVYAPTVNTNPVYTSSVIIGGGYVLSNLLQSVLGRRGFSAEPSYQSYASKGYTPYTGIGDTQTTKVVTKSQEPIRSTDEVKSTAPEVDSLKKIAGVETKTEEKISSMPQSTDSELCENSGNLKKVFSKIDKIFPVSYKFDKYEDSVNMGEYDGDGNEINIGNNKLTAKDKAKVKEFIKHIVNSEPSLVKTQLTKFKIFYNTKGTTSQGGEGAMNVRSDDPHTLNINVYDLTFPIGVLLHGQAIYHEFAHILAFNEDKSSPYSNEKFKNLYWVPAKKDGYVSSYAKKSHREDYAESFMNYLFYCDLKNENKYNDVALSKISFFALSEEVRKMKKEIKEKIDKY